jgi:hypothetical protein
MINQVGQKKDWSLLANIGHEITAKQYVQYALLQKVLLAIYEQYGIRQLQKSTEHIPHDEVVAELQKQERYFSKIICLAVNNTKMQAYSTDAQSAYAASEHSTARMQLLQYYKYFLDANDFLLADAPESSNKYKLIRQPANSVSTENDSIPIVPIEIGKWVTVSLLQKMAQDEFVAGETSASEEYIESIAVEYGWPATMNWLNAIYIDNYDNSDILIGLMHCLSHFNYEDVKPAGPTMALGVLQHSDVYVRDYAVRAFENWKDREIVPILKALSCEAKWLQNYINDVIEELESCAEDEYVCFN